MKVTLTEMHSIQDAIRTLYMSKRTWNQDVEDRIFEAVRFNTFPNGKPHDHAFEQETDFNDMVTKLFKWGQKHTTMLRFLDLSVVVEGLHRGATDDFDAHAKRLENRIIRSNTRLADYKPGEMSDWYKGKILTYDEVAEGLELEIPDRFERDGVAYVRTTNGFIREDLANNRDVKRGLYMLSIPMTFTFKVNIVELAHIYRERGTKEGGAHGTAAPELQEMIEELIDQVNSWYPQITRDYLLGICN